MYRNERHSLSANVPSDKAQAIPLMTENLLLRGSRIKNTDWAIGCAVYTGTKLISTIFFFVYTFEKICIL